MDCLGHDIVVQALLIKHDVRPDDAAAVTVRHTGAVIDALRRIRPAAAHAVAAVDAAMQLEHILAPGRLMHGPTFMANPLACAAGCASLDLFQEYDWAGNVAKIEAQLKRELAPAAAMDNVASVRALGAIGVIELRNPVGPGEIMPMLLERGVWLRPFGNYLYTMPPLVIGEEDLRKVTSAMLDIAGLGGI